MGIPVDIIMPKIAPVVKQDRTKKFGGNVKIVGDDLEQVRKWDNIQEGNFIRKNMWLFSMSS